jgi:predicted Mrr-cat superfamily restriction endonuclease
LHFVPRRVWVVRGGEENRHVDAFLAGGYTAVGYPDIPDGHSVDRYDVTERLRSRGWTVPEARAERFEQFVRQIAIGDLVVMPDTPRREVVIGRVEGDYEFHAFVDPDDYRHRRVVEWIGRHSIDLLPASVRDAYKQRQTLALMSSAVLLAHAESVERGELGRDARDLAPASPPKSTRTPRAPRPPAVPKPVVPADRTCPGCWLQKAPNQFREGSEVCTDCE